MRIRATTPTTLGDGGGTVINLFGLGDYRLFAKEQGETRFCAEAVFPRVV
jgi:hypothetical protein